MSFPHHRFAVAAALLALPTTLPAQEWQGIVHTRDISFDAGLFADRIGEDAEGVLDIPIEDILAARGGADAEQWNLTVNEATLQIRGPWIRTDLGQDMPEELGGGGWGVINLAEGMMYMVMPARQTIMEVAVEEIRQLMDAMPTPEPTPEPEVEALDGHRTIHGVRCAGYRLRTADGVTVAWVSDADAELHETYREFADLVGQMDTGEEVDPDLLLAPYGFPMLSYKIGGSEVQIEETLSVERSAVAESVFALPEGYQRVSMADMMRQQLEQMQRKN